MELQQGDFIIIQLSRFPVPTVCYEDQVCPLCLSTTFSESDLIYLNVSLEY